MEELAPKGLLVDDVDGVLDVPDISGTSLMDSFKKILIIRHQKC